MVDGKKIVAIIQARMSSTRLPGKVMMNLLGRSIFENVVERVKMSEVVDEIWLATSTEKSDDILEVVAKNIGIKIFRGSLEDVLSRFSSIVELANADIVVRVTADNPLTEPRFITHGVGELIKSDIDYLCYENIPYGSGSEIVKATAIKYTQNSTSDAFDREHVTPYIINNDKFNSKKHPCPISSLASKNISVTVDTPEDFIKVFTIAKNYSDIKDVKLEDYVK
jgi:spore coat polysaccharide biosynthesis protein SpsF